MLVSGMLVIRNFAEEDRAKLASIYLECRAQTFHWMLQNSFRLEDFTVDTDGETILVAENASGIIGFISIWLPDHFIHHLFVHAQHRKLGTGDRLLGEALALIGRPARLKCVVRNAQACKFYEKRGWAVESTAENGPMGPYHSYRLG